MSCRLLCERHTCSRCLDFVACMGSFTSLFMLVRLLIHVLGYALLDDQGFSRGIKMVFITRLTACPTSYFQCDSWSANSRILFPLLLLGAAFSSTFLLSSFRWGPSIGGAVCSIGWCQSTSKQVCICSFWLFAPSRTIATCRWLATLWTAWQDRTPMVTRLRP